MEGGSRETRGAGEEGSAPVHRRTLCDASLYRAREVVLACVSTPCAPQGPVWQGCSPVVARPEMPLVTAGWWSQPTGGNMYRSIGGASALRRLFLAVCCVAAVTATLATGAQA